MSTDEYVPSDEQVRTTFVEGASEDAYAMSWHEPYAEAYDRWLSAHDARVRRDAQREAARMIRDACDRWEIDGDDERLVNDVLDPWTSRVLRPEETP